MRFSRPCYDKPHRCPGWIGGGWKYPKVNRCPPDGGDDGGYMSGFKGQPVSPYWRFQKCSKCDVITWPYAVHWIDPTWWRYGWKTIPGKIVDYIEMMRVWRIPRLIKKIRRK